MDWRRHKATPRTTDATVVQKVGEAGDVTGELIGETDDLTPGIVTQQYPAAVWPLASLFAASNFAHEPLLGWRRALRLLGMLGVPGPGSPGVPALHL